MPTQAHAVGVCDREADIFELFAHAQQNPAGPKLLIRAGRSKRRTTDCQTRVGEELARQPIAGHLKLKIPRKGSRSARTARLAVRFASVTLMPPQKNQQEKPVPVWVVGAQEQGDSGSEVKSPVDWMVVTTVKTSTFEQACERLSWYAKRWGIEVYHRTLKSGCRIQDRQLHDAKNLEKCLAVDLVVAWRIYWLTQQGRETPDIPCDRFFKEEEWKVLCAYHHKAQPPPKPPPIGKAIPMLAKLGGYLGRKQDGPPGTMTLWRGLMKLEGLVAGVALAQSLHLARDGP